MLKICYAYLKELKLFGNKCIADIARYALRTWADDITNF